MYGTHSQATSTLTRTNQTEGRRSGLIGSETIRLSKPRIPQDVESKSYQSEVLKSYSAWSWSDRMNQIKFYKTLMTIHPTRWPTAAELRTDHLARMLLRRLSVISRHLNPLNRMTTIHGDACCSIPPVLVDYSPEGTYRPHGKFGRVYVTGDRSQTALIVVYDIFGRVGSTVC
jgi:hypothetical protein